MNTRPDNPPPEYALANPSAEDLANFDEPTGAALTPASIEGLDLGGSTQEVVGQDDSQKSDLASKLQEMEAALSAAAQGGAGGGGFESSDLPAIHFETVKDWVDGFARRRYEVPTLDAKDVLWCHSWAQHEGVEYIFQCLWRSYEEARQADWANGGGQSQTIWVSSSFIPLMDWVTHKNGPFRLCGERHRQPKLIGESSLGPGQGQAPQPLPHTIREY